MSTAAEKLATNSSSFNEQSLDQSHAAEQAATSTGEISTSIDRVASAMENANSSMGEINEKLKTLSESNKVISNSMESFTSLAKVTAEKAEGSEEMIRLTTEAMDKIQNSTRKITDFTSIITEISDQTNLLSLNASIEASRAGDSGRGFAVVAQEITKLADRTLSSVKEVKNLISDTLTAVEQGNIQVGAVADNVRVIIQNVQEMNKHSKDIMSLIWNQSENTTIISLNANSLADFISELLTTVNEQRIVSHEMQETIHQVSTSASSVSQGAQELATLSKSLRDESENLLHMVEKFQL